MLIKDISSIVVNVSDYSNWIFVFVHTDEGLIGVGESTLDGYEKQVVRTIEDLKHHFVNKDPIACKISPNVKKGGMIYSAALSGIDIALWDIKGKALNAPIYTLLGGKLRQEIPMYISFNRVLKSRTYKDFAKIAEKLIATGNIAIKCAPFDNYSYKNAFDSNKYLTNGVNRIRAVREAIGDDINLMIDNHWRFNLPVAIDVANRIRKYNPFWFEAPISEKDAEEVSIVRKLTGLRIAGFEMQTDSSMVIPFLENNSLDIYMPDIKYIGGISGMLEVNSLIKNYNGLISPHNMTGPVSTLASMHVSATFENLINLEHHMDEADYIQELSDFSFEVKDGMQKINKKPGLGITLNIDKLRKYPYKKTIAFRENMLGS